LRLLTFGFASLTKNAEHSCDKSVPPLSHLLPLLRQHLVLYTKFFGLSTPFLKIFQLFKIS